MRKRSTKVKPSHPAPPPDKPRINKQQGSQDARINRNDSELHMALLAWKNGSITMVELKKFIAIHAGRLADERAVEADKWWPTCYFNYKGKEYKFPFRLGCDAGLTITSLTDPNAESLLGGYTEREIIATIESGKLKPLNQGSDSSPKDRGKI
jgi:hypothetical protein